MLEHEERVIFGSRTLTRREKRWWVVENKPTFCSHEDMMGPLNLIRFYRMKWYRLWRRFPPGTACQGDPLLALYGPARSFGPTSMATNTLPDYVRVGNRTLSYLLGGILLEGSGQGVKARTS
jgi:hypothetical protein